MSDLIAPIRPTVGSTVAVISPATDGVNRWPKRVRQLRDFMAQLGLRVEFLPPGAPDLPFGSAREADAAARSVMHAFERDDVSAVLCAMGGNSTVRVVDRLDYQVIRASRKLFHGSSDITGLHEAIHARAGLATLYGPNGLFSLAEFAVHPWTRDSLLQAWFGGEALTIGPAPGWTDDLYPLASIDDGEPDPVREIRPGTGWTTIRPGVAHGRMDGGCLETLAWHHPLARPSEVGRLVLLDIAGTGTRVRGSLVGGPRDAATWMMSLKARGYLDTAVGVMVSRARGYSTTERAALLDAVDAVLSDLAIPVVAEVDIGHTDPMATVPLGRMATLDTESAVLRFHEPATTTGDGA